MKITEEKIHYLCEDFVALETERKKEKYYVLIDRADVPKILNRSVYLFKKGIRIPVLYVMISLGKRRKDYLHLYLAEQRPPSGYVIHHIHGDTLDNRKSQLKMCTIGQNTKSTGKKGVNTSSKYKGVCLLKRSGRWQAQIMCDRISRNQGAYLTESEAAEAYNRAAIKYFGEFAKLNVIE